MDFLNLLTILNTVIAYTVLPEINSMTSALYIQGWITAPNPSMFVWFGLDRVSWSLAWLQTFYVAKNDLEFQLSYIYLSPLRCKDELHRVLNNIFIFTYIFLFWAKNMNGWVHVCHHASTEIRRQFAGIIYFLSPRGFQGLNSSHQACWQMPLPASHLTRIFVNMIVIRTFPEKSLFSQR